HRQRFRGWDYLSDQVSRATDAPDSRSEVHRITNRAELEPRGPPGCGGSRWALERCRGRIQPAPRFPFFTSPILSNPILTDSQEDGLLRSPFGHGLCSDGQGLCLRKKERAAKRDARNRCSFEKVRRESKLQIQDWKSGSMMSETWLFCARAPP